MDPTPKASPGASSPLADRMRPRHMDEFVGQSHIAAPGRLLRRAIQADQLSSLIFFGPPGTGKTTLARVIANTTRSRFTPLNAVLTGVKDLRQAIDGAQKDRRKSGLKTILFVDEIHRWNKAQQDALLPWVENGTVVLVGATTENPFFSVNSPLVSRSRIFRLEPLEKGDLLKIAHQALSDPERGYGSLNVRFEEGSLEHLVNVAGGDARSLLNALELAVETTEPDENGVILVDMAVAEESIQSRAVLYDRDGDAHYDAISAFIKSLRGSDPDAALYWLARMVYAGEDPRFIFRRMLILAGEDVGLADPNAICVVTACADAFDRVGLPEGRFHLAEAAVYLATAPKSNSVLGFFDALKTVQEEGRATVPSHLKDASRDKKGFGHGEGYQYPHAFRDHWTPQQYLPDKLQGKVFYQPSAQGREKDISLKVTRLREAQMAAMAEEASPTSAEVLTFSPVDGMREKWLRRAISNTGAHLGRIRDRILDQAAILRHYNVLDLNAGVGLLTWEAVRRTPEGSVWALVQNEPAAKDLRSYTANLSELGRPELLVGPVEKIGNLLEAGGQGKVRFDAVVGRNAFLSVHDKEAAFEALIPVLMPGGVLSLVEAVPRRGQRIYDLVDRKGISENLVQKWIAAEEAIFSDSNEPLVNWDEADLKKCIEAAGFKVKDFDLEKTFSSVVVNKALMARWFPEQTDDLKKTAKPSYAQKLAPFLSSEEVRQIQVHIRENLLGREVLWSSEYVCLLALALK